MTDIWSLVIFTVMAQCAVGLSLFIALDGDGRHSAVRQTWVCIGILMVGTLISLTHLSQPFISFYSITGAASSWLSREILFAGLFGAAMLAGMLFRLPVLRWLASAVGLVFVFMMGNVYRIPNQPQWNSWLLPVGFFATSILLGGVAKLLLDMIEDRHDAQAQRRGILSWLPPVIALAVIARLLVLLLRFSQPGHAFTREGSAHAVLLMAGALGLMCLYRVAARFTDGREANRPPVSFLGGAALLFALIAVAEICGRVALYRSYVFFGM